MIRENTAIIGGGLWEDMCGILDLPTRTSPVAFEGALARAMKNSELQYQRIAELEAENKRLRSLVNSDRLNVSDEMVEDALIAEKAVQLVRRSIVDRVSDNNGWHVELFTDEDAWKEFYKSIPSARLSSPRAVGE